MKQTLALTLTILYFLVLKFPKSLKWLQYWANKFDVTHIHKDSRYS